MGHALVFSFPDGVGEFGENPRGGQESLGEAGRVFAGALMRLIVWIGQGQVVGRVGEDEVHFLGVP